VLGGRGGGTRHCARCDRFQYLNHHAEISALAESGNAVSAELLQRGGREVGAAVVSNAFVKAALNVLKRPEMAHCTASTLRARMSTRVHRLHNLFPLDGKVLAGALREVRRQEEQTTLGNENRVPAAPANAPLSCGTAAQLDAHMGQGDVAYTEWTLANARDASKAEQQESLRTMVDKHARTAGRGMQVVSHQGSLCDQAGDDVWEGDHEGAAASAGRQGGHQDAIGQEQGERPHLRGERRPVTTGQLLLNVLT
jgi:hypothetical protein